MKYKLHLSLFILQFVVIAVSFSQTTNVANHSPILYVPGSTLGPVSGSGLTPLSELNYTGSPFINDEYLACEIFYNDKSYGKMFYKYNAYNEEIQIKNSLYKKDFSALKREKTVYIVVDGIPLKFQNFLNKNGKKMRGYLFSLVNDKYSFYKRKNVKYTEPSKAPTSFSKDIPAKFRKFVAYYFQKENGEIIEIEPKKKKILNWLSFKDKNLLEKWAAFKTKKFNKEKDLIEIFNYLNSN